MGYTMEVYVDGGCRRNGQSSAIGAAAACFKTREGLHIPHSISLPKHPRPTNQRAEIQAIILALEKVIERYNELRSCPHLTVTIYTDSKYALGCMRTWIYKWVQNGFINATGNEVANRDLIEEASGLDDEVAKLGNIDYVWIPRDQNPEADRVCNQCLDEQEEDLESDGYSSSDDDYYY